MSERLHQRVWDLLRQQRMELLDAKLISEEEYAELATLKPSGSPRRLETYDAIRGRLEAAHKALRDLGHGTETETVGCPEWGYDLGAKCPGCEALRK